MPPQIEIDDQVMDALKERAEPFVDTPNSVLRRMLGLNGTPAIDPLSADAVGSGSASGPRTKSAKRRRASGSSGSQGRTRAPSGSLLPEAEYELPILRVLADHGGRAASREVVEEVGALLRDKLMPKDLERLDSGDIRWQNRVHFRRLRMIDRGLLRKGSPRGTWEISDEGLALLSRS